MKQKRGQISTEYLIVVGFIVFVVLTVLGIAMFYTNQIQETVKINQLEKAARKIIFSAETTFYDGEPAKATIEAYFPIGIETISILNNEIVFNVSLSSGQNIISFPSSVPLQGALSKSSGLKKVQLTAKEGYVTITEI